MEEETMKKEVESILEIIQLERLGVTDSNKIQSLLRTLSIEAMAKTFRLCREKLISAILAADSAQKSADVQQTSESAEEAEEWQREIEEWSEIKECARKILLATMEKWDEVTLSRVALGRDGSTLAKFAFRVLVQKMRELPDDERQKIITERTRDPIVIKAALDAQVEKVRIVEIEKKLGLNPVS